MRKILAGLRKANLIAYILVMMAWPAMLAVAAVVFVYGLFK